MILEGIVTTRNADGSPNVAPMGPRVEPTMERFVLRPFRTSTTYRNLKALGEGVFHVTDDVVLLARSAIGVVHDAPTRPTRSVRGWVLTEACRAYEFRVTDLDEREDRVSFTCETVDRQTIREFFGFNRAKHAVLETAILATRVGFLPGDQISRELEIHRVVVGKTGGPAETLAFQILEDHITSAARRSGPVGGGSACRPA